MTAPQAPSTSTQQAYKLKHELSHLEAADRDYDALLVKSPTQKGLKSSFWEPQQLQISEPIRLQTYPDVLQTSDFPYPNVSLPIMSKRMLQTLLSVREFPHQVIPVVMVANGVANHDYVAVQLLEHLDVFDWENSVYEPHPLSTSFVTNVRKLVLKEPAEGFPSLFRISTLSTLLYTSAAARTALEAAGIQGVKFMKLENYC